MSKRKTREEFIQEANQIHNFKYDYSLVKYQRNSIKIKIICLKHGEFEQIPKDHLNGRGCQKCGLEKQGLNQRLSQENFIKRSLELHENKYDYSKVKYTLSSKKIVIICPIHGEFKQIANDHIKGIGCKKCANKAISRSKTLSREEFERRARLIHGNLYDYSKAADIDKEYRRIIICPKHGEFKQIGSNHLQGNGCPKCNMSKGELAIKEFLLLNNISFENQKTFEDCKNKRKLPFDFYLPDYNLCIEYDGIQHFKPVQFNGTLEEAKENFKQTKENDQIKNQYCKDNNIKLLRIPYWKLPNIKIILEYTLINSKTKEI